jgi:hypothetical protein
MSFTIPIPEVPDLPDLVLPDGVPPVEINLPPFWLCTYALECRLCGGTVHGSFCANGPAGPDGWPVDFNEHCANHPRICHICTAKEN